METIDQVLARFQKLNRYFSIYNSICITIHKLVLYITTHLIKNIVSYTKHKLVITYTFIFIEPNRSDHISYHSQNKTE